MTEKQISDKMFIKMLVDKHNKLKSEYDELQAKCHRLELKNALWQNRFNTIAYNVQTSPMYKRVLNKNKKLKAQYKSIKRSNDELLSKLNKLS